MSRVLDSLMTGGYDPYDCDPCDVAFCEEHDSDDLYDYLVDPRGDETVYPVCKQGYVDIDDLPF